MKKKTLLIIVFPLLIFSIHIPRILLGETQMIKEGAIQQHMFFFPLVLIIFAALHFTIVSQDIETGKSSSIAS